MQKTTLPAPTARKHSRKRQTVQISGWGKPQLREAMQLIAKQEGISFSQIVVAFCEAGVREKYHIQQEMLAQPILEAAIDRKMNRLMNRLAEFLGRSVYEAGQVRWLFVNFLYRQVLNPDKQLTKEEFYNLLDTSQKETIKAVRRWNPHIQDVVSAIKDFLKGEEGEQT
jgi:hypothetical protein